MEEEVDAEEILPEDQMEQKDNKGQQDNNPWAEGPEAGPRDSEKLFLKVKVALLCCVCFRYRTSSIFKPYFICQFE